MKYSLGAMLLHGLRGNRHWPPAWRSPEPKRHYDVVIIGGGGHGLATAYYLAREHHLTNVAVLERGWIGGGNTGRNTTNVRSNYMFPESAELYELALRLYEKLALEFNFNIMLSQRGFMELIHDDHQMEAARHKVNWMHCNGIDAEFLDPDAVHRMVPLLNTDDAARYPVLGASLQRRGGTIRHDAVAWGYARGADRHGVDIIQDCEVTGLERDGEHITAVQTTRGRIGAGAVGVAAAASTTQIAGMAGFRLPMTSYCLQAMVSEPIRPVLDVVVISPSTGVYVNQTQKGELVIGGILDPYQSNSRLGSYFTIEKMLSAVVDMFPQVGQLRLLRHWGGTVDIVPDRSPILGATPVANMYINCGWGTGGFKAIPAGGYLLAHSIATGTPHKLAERFGLDRFFTNRLVDETSASGIAH